MKSGSTGRAAVLASVVATLVFPAFAAAQETPDAPRTLTLQPLPPDAAERAAKAPSDTRDEAPRHAFVESPFNLASGVMMAALTGTGTAAKGANAGEGGVRIGGSPVSRLVVHGLVGRGTDGKWAPTATAHYRFFGSLADGYALGALAQYKTVGFTEAGGEAEIGVTGGLRRKHFYLDANVVAGVGVEAGEVGELDGEGKLRLGFELDETFRFGVEGQIRDRLAGDKPLPNHRAFDVLGGPQILASWGRFVFAATGGATTMNVAQGVGGFGTLTLTALTL